MFMETRLVVGIVVVVGVVGIVRVVGFVGVILKISILAIFHFMFVFLTYIRIAQVKAKMTTMTQNSLDTQVVPFSKM